MIILGVNSGFGNQLFEYAFAYALAKKSGQRLIVETHSYKHYSSNYSYDLGTLNIKLDEIKLPVAKKYTRPYRIIAGVQRKLCLLFKYQAKCIEEDPKDYCTYNPKYQKRYKNTYYKGFFQSERYFKEYEEDIRVLFQPKKGVIRKKAQEMIERVSSEPSVAIHIRRGDYPKSWLVDKEFFINAYKLMEEKIGEQKIYIFCTDKEFVQEVFQGYNYEIVTNRERYNDKEEFYIMSACANQIISNSTYSWWAAWLNKNRNKMVIAPDKDMWSGDFYPPEWVTLKGY